MHSRHYISNLCHHITNITGIVSWFQYITVHEQQNDRFNLIEFAIFCRTLAEPVASHVNFVLISHISP
jgi:hypothetical protein